MVESYRKAEGYRLSDRFVSTHFDCPCKRSACRVTLVDPRLIVGLDDLAVTFPLIITSGFRCEPHNKEVGGAPRSLHLTGQAADVSSAFATPNELKIAAEKISCFSQGGIAQYRSHIHVDTRLGKTRWDSLETP